MTRTRRPSSPGSSTAIPWTTLRVWTYEASHANAILGPRAAGELLLLKLGSPSPRTWVLAGSEVVSQPDSVDWTGFPEEEALETAEQILASRSPARARSGPLRRPTRMQIEALRHIDEDPEGIVRERMHGARSASLLERGLLEEVEVGGQAVRRISPAGRELLQTSSPGRSRRHS